MELEYPTKTFRRMCKKCRSMQDFEIVSYSKEKGYCFACLNCGSPKVIKYFKKNKSVIQEHHLEYQRKDKTIEKTGETVLIYKGEHWAITQLQRRKNISKGFIKALKFWIEQVEGIAIELETA